MPSQREPRIPAPTRVFRQVATIEVIWTVDPQLKMDSGAHHDGVPFTDLGERLRGVVQEGDLLGPYPWTQAGQIEVGPIEELTCDG